MKVSVVIRIRNRGDLEAVILSLILVVVTLVVYWPVQSFDFVNFDDPIYITRNSAIQNGVTWQGILWAFSTFHAANWHPLTWLSHMIDFSLYQFRAGGHHWTSLQIHLLNTLLLFLVLRRMTGASKCSALVAMLFAIHPLHVESVAWISERKDVLSGFFWILTMGCYTYYVERPTVFRYSLVILFLAFGLMSKPMVVTLPIVLLLIDVWPLRRHGNPTTVFDPFFLRFRSFKGKWFICLAVEKLPMILLILASCVVTLIAQEKAGAVVSIESIELGDRVANAIASYGAYIRKMLWPNDLAISYPFREDLLSWKTGLILVALAGISVGAIIRAHSSPFLLVGWLWFLGTLVPVIGIVQVGSQAMADRYTYIPLIGLFMGIAWAGRSVTDRHPRVKKIVIITILVFCVIMAVGARTQVEAWRNSVTLYEHALGVAPENPIVLNNLGVVYLDAGVPDRAAPLFKRAIDIAPHYQDPWINLGVVALRNEDLVEAKRCMIEAYKINPQNANLRLSMGILLIKKGDQGAAEREFRQVLAIDSHNETANHRLGILLFLQGRLDESQKFLQAALRVSPLNAEIYNDIGLVLKQKGNIEEAVMMFQKALYLDPGNPDFERNIRSVRVDDSRNSLSHHKRENPCTS
ncbi:MAG TPA: tetratricopeptide repeat protein [Syntrophales bacterium]|nr:tetratricopeptide repeat protein [Syntrophales bacterium]